jgi:hypothetical protein
MRTVSSNHAASGCHPGGFLSLPRHMATMDTLAALYSSICAAGAGAASQVEAPARLVAQQQNAAKRRTVLALLRHSGLPHSVERGFWILMQRCWRRAVALGRVVPRRRANAPAARGGRN